MNSKSSKRSKNSKSSEAEKLEFRAQKTARVLSFELNSCQPYLLPWLLRGRLKSRGRTRLYPHPHHLLWEMQRRFLTFSLFLCSSSHERSNQTVVKMRVRVKLRRKIHDGPAGGRSSPWPSLMVDRLLRSALLKSWATVEVAIWGKKLNRKFLYFMWIQKFYKYFGILEWLKII